MNFTTLNLRGDAPVCRQRRPRLNTYRVIALGGALPPTRLERSTTWNAAAPGICFFIAMAAFMLSGILCISSPEEPTASFGEHKIPPEASCARITRHTNYVAVDLAVGSPAVVLKLLLRLDTVKEANGTAVRLFSNRVAESETVACEGSVCRDVALVTVGGPAEPQSRIVFSFEYTNPTTESVSHSTASTIGLSGEFALLQGTDYFLTASHLCWAPLGHARVTDGSNGFPARVDEGLLVADASDIAAALVFESAPVAVAADGSTCAAGVGQVSLFPGAAADEATWLGIASKRAFESSPEGVEERRVVVEVSEACASGGEIYERAHSLYEMDCSSIFFDCTVGPSLPFRRAASTQMRIQLYGDGGAHVFAERDGRLASLPQMDPAHTMTLAVIKLTLMVLAAAVTWVRSAKATASVSRLFLHCIRAAHCPVMNEDTLQGTVVLEDQIIGLVAVIARLAVSIWRLFTLSEDGMWRAPLAQLVASGLSLVLWAMRYFVLDRHCETPLTKLGGSTALVDATSAVLLAFAQAPLFVSSAGRFDPTARLLTSLLITTMTLQRCLFAVACCSALWAVASEDSSRRPNATHAFTWEYALCAFVGLVAWLLQTASLGILLADVFVAPIAFSNSRTYVGGHGELSMAMFCGIVASGLPGLMRTLETVAETPVQRVVAE